MNIIGWIVIGALAGWIGSLFTGNDKRMGAVANIMVGIVGALVGGFIMNLAGGVGITGFNLWSLLVATVGAIILLAVMGAIRKRM
jgi:uncharacterized membrane protein YeaQ/YmgE (transglycosylase-associated protein family)